jgi:hypothetical protein
MERCEQSARNTARHDGNQCARVDSKPALSEYVR